MRRYLPTKPWNYISTAPKKDSEEDQLQACEWSSTKTCQCCHKSTTYHWNQPTIWITFDHWHRTVINGSHSPSKLWRLLRRPDLTTRTRKANKSVTQKRQNSCPPSLRASDMFVWVHTFFLSMTTSLDQAFFSHLFRVYVKEKKRVELKRFVH